MTKKRRAVVCLSGGMDSTALLVRLLAEGRKVYGLSFDYGQKHRIELARLKQNVEYGGFWEQFDETPETLEDYEISYQVMSKNKESDKPAKLVKFDAEV